MAGIPAVDNERIRTPGKDHQCGGFDVPISLAASAL